MGKKMDLSKIVAAQMAEYEKNKDKIQAEIRKKAEENKNCLSYWFPIVAAIPEIKVPDTKIFKVDYVDQLNALDKGVSEEIKKVVEEIKAVGKEWGYPLFIKNSLFSGKHSWKHTCFVEKEEDILNHFLALTDMGYAFGVDECLYWVVRKYLKPEALIYTDMDMPVTFERRYFVEDGKVTFHHPYWPPHALENQGPTPENWRELLVVTNHESDEEIKLLKHLTELVGEKFKGSWSVDWLKVGDEWYLIDMAEKHRSYIWQDYSEGKKGL